ncbi:MULTISPECIES: hypothetical protein [unclassified Pseudomonas]|uniref:hypothetical protein n=1 Tax=unclassified Pseudomonas TaxID=196821 RepID=UPI0021BAD2C7|nr:MULTISPECIES: hypothetical protein [unclassified Pseudomonas]MCT8165017.1 hypothetical protein [Pseudomonas sp. HD6422]MCT8183915.1 hypothetical protein [Pseudomonas sp. HD6421]
MSKDQEFEPRPAFTIDWDRQYDCGPSDPHLHAIGQFIANYSSVEWKIAELFALTIGKPVAEAQRICVETNMSIAGMVRYTKSKLSEISGPHEETARDLVFSIEAFERISPTRHKIVHWQWGLNEGDHATISDLIKPRTPEKANTAMKLEDLRNHCLSLMKIFRAIILGLEVLSGRMTRQQILEVRKDTSPEKLFRP